MFAGLSTFSGRAKRHLPPSVTKFTFSEGCDTARFKRFLPENTGLFPNLRSRRCIFQVQRHINEFCEEERGPVLERHGAARAYKYRFHDPLLPPYIFMNALAEGSLTGSQLSQLTSASQ